MGPTLAGVASPADLRRLGEAELDALATEIRAFLVQQVARAGSGHLGPNLGVVELTIALHRVFDSPAEPILFDTGHQSYVHKILTGRRDAFDTLRSAGGLSGYPSRAESEHDWIENSHASTALSYADGMAKAFAVRGIRRPVVALVGDGALTGGMCWEALNNIAAADRPVVIVVNDNGRSYSPTIGGLATRLTALRLRPGYERVLGTVKRRLPAVPVVGGPLYGALHGMKRGVKDLLAPQGLFEDLGLKYVGPVDGHDRVSVERALRMAREFGGPVIVHCVTSKGHGYAPAENDEIEQMHAPGAFDPATGRKLPKPGKKWTGVFSEELVRLGHERPDIVAITAAMCHPTGLAEFARVHPDRCYDVGIAEQHALTSAAGLASAGLHPVVAVYSTFLNRAFDQLLMDVALHRLPVTVVLDRAGITGEDGPSHNGMWDLALLGVVPGLRMAAPRDCARLRQELGEALEVTEGPTVLRFPKTTPPANMPAVRQVGGVDVLGERDAGRTDVLIVAVGSCAADALAAAPLVREVGHSVRVVDPRWVRPFDPALAELAAQSALVVSVEDGVVTGGVGSRLAQWLGAQDLDVPVRQIGIPAQFLAHGKAADIRTEVGLDAEGIAARVLGWCAGYAITSLRS